MSESVYKVIELIGTSPDSWEKAAANAVEQAGKTLRDLRVAEVAQSFRGLLDRVGSRPLPGIAGRTDQFNDLVDALSHVVLPFR